MQSVDDSIVKGIEVYPSPPKKQEEYCQLVLESKEQMDGHIKQQEGGSQDEKSCHSEESWWEIYDET